MVLPRSAFAHSLLVLLSLSLPSLAQTVLWDFSSQTCGPCQEMRPTINRLAAAGYQIRKVDIHQEPQVADRFGVTQVPTFIVMVNGRETSRIVGGTSYQQLHRMLTQRRTPPPMRRPELRGQSPDTFAAPAPPAIQSTFAEDDLATPQAGRIGVIQDPALTAVAPAQQAAANPFPTIPTGQVPPPVGSVVENQRLIEITVKVSVQDSEGVSAGTGTIVDARSGEALVLTCGHLFRESAGKGPITVTLFKAGPAGAEILTTATGQLINYDLERDLALLSMRTEIPVQPAQIAQPGAQFTPGAAVTTVGCNHGQNPTALRSQITTIDRYQGHPNVEVAGAPVEGRSGGGLFNAAGQLIGVCFAADPQSNEGLYASLPSIIAKLDSLNLQMVYQSPSSAPQPVSTAQQPVQQPIAPASDPSFAVRGQEPIASPPQMGTPVSLAPASPAAVSLSPAEQAALEEIQFRSETAEVICIIRPKNADGKSEVISLSNASPQFVRSLADLVAGQGQTRK